MGTNSLRRMQSTLALMACLAAAPFQAAAQFGPLLDLEGAPQATTQEEFDAYLEILAAADDSDRVTQVESFLAAHPESALHGRASVHQMEAYKRLDDFAGVLRTGEQVLELLPDNLRALLTLASAIPNAVQGGPDDNAMLDRAESYARRALAVMEGKKIPLSISLEDWKLFRAGMASEAHEALGHIAAKRGLIDRAITELEMAVGMNPTPEGRQFYRLGAAYASVGRTQDGTAALERAVALGPALIRRRAEQELRTLAGQTPAVGRP